MDKGTLLREQITVKQGKIMDVVRLTKAINMVLKSNDFYPYFYCLNLKKLMLIVNFTIITKALIDNYENCRFTI
jgi:hypothetical protein